MLKFLIPAAIFVAILIVIFRLFGAWMLRINEVIILLKDIRALLQMGASENSSYTTAKSIPDADNTIEPTDKHPTRYDDIV